MIFDYAKIALACLQLANTFASWARNTNQIDAGKDIAIGQASLDILKSTNWGKEIAEKIDAMDDPALSDIELQLERERTNNKQES